MICGTIHFNTMLLQVLDMMMLLSVLHNEVKFGITHYAHLHLKMSFGTKVVLISL
jgi:hypothetical protein